MEPLSLPQLQAACKERGLSAYGNTDELLTRLNAAEAANLAAMPEPEVPTEAVDSSTATMRASGAVSTPEAVATNNLDAQRAVTAIGAVSGGSAGVGKVLLPTIAEMEHLATRPTVAIETVKQVVADINTKYGSCMKAQYNPDHECIDFTGGLQGKWCTTVHQPAKMILNRDGIKGAADQYATIAREAKAQAMRRQANGLFDVGMVGGGIN